MVSGLIAGLIFLVTIFEFFDAPSYIPRVGLGKFLSAFRVWAVTLALITSISFVWAEGQEGPFDDSIKPVFEPEIEEVLDEYSARRPDRKPGIYIMRDAYHTTTREPLAGLSEEELQRFVRENAQVDGWGVAIVGLPILGGKELKKIAKDAEKEGQIPRTLIIRRPTNAVEHVLDIPLRKQDWVAPSDDILATATVTDVLDSGVGALAAFSSLPLAAAASVTGFAYVAGGFFYYLFPFHLNLWSRLGPVKLGVWNFLLSLGIGTGFSLAANTGDVGAVITNWWPAVPTSALINTLWRPFVGKAIASWQEDFKGNAFPDKKVREVVSARLNLLGTLMGGPAFIYSTFPDAAVAFKLGDLAVNYGHLGMATTAALFTVSLFVPQILNVAGKGMNKLAEIFAPLGRPLRWATLSCANRIRSLAVRSRKKASAATQ